MGFFSKKKGLKESSAALSEAEIHRKLYGEFETSSSRVVVGEQEHFKTTSISAPVISNVSHSAARDLFSAPRHETAESETAKRPVRLEVKSPEPTPRHVPIYEFEKKAASPSSFSGASSGDRFRLNSSSQMPASVKASAIFSQVFSWMKGLLEFALNPQNILLRRILYWCAAVIVVFSLFWGVNTLNSSREEAMKAPYRGHREVAPEAAKAVVTESADTRTKAVSSERSVVITPAPVVPKVREVVITPVVPTRQKSVTSEVVGSYAIQVVTYPSQVDADQLMETLKQDRLRAFVKEYKRPSGRFFYVVFLGPYRTEAEAQNQLTRFRSREVSKPFQDAFVKTI